MALFERGDPAAAVPHFRLAAQAEPRNAKRSLKCQRSPARGVSLVSEVSAKGVTVAAFVEVTISVCEAS